jgi:enoyl-CoA hydratase
VPHAVLIPFTRQLALDIVNNDQAGVRQIRATYAEVAATTVVDGWQVEARDARAWSEARFDPAEVERRRAAILERGRSHAW